MLLHTVGMSNTANRAHGEKGRGAMCQCVWHWEGAGEPSAVRGPTKHAGHTLPHYAGSPHTCRG